MKLPKNLKNQHLLSQNISPSTPAASYLPLGQGIVSALT